MSGVRLVLFDNDRTHHTRDGSARRAFEASLAHVFGSPGDPRVRFDGKTDPQIARELMRGAGHDDAAIDARLSATIDGYLARLRQEVAGGARRFVLLPGVVALLDALAARDDVVLGLVTGNVAEGAAVKLESAGLDIGRFRVNAFGSDHEHRPELPRVAQRRAQALLGRAVAGEAMWVIGDTPADIHCARSVGARTIAVATGRYSMAELAEHAPTHTFADLTDTDAVLAALLG